MDYKRKNKVKVKVKAKSKPKSKSKHRPPGNTITELSPDILLFHILPRLPAKSLRRFRFVSKQWYEFITTPVFAQMHLHYQNQIQNQNQNHHKLLHFSDSTFRTMDIDCENPGNCTFTFGKVHLPFNVIGHNLTALKSLHGMALCVIAKCDGDDLILWNPVTGDYKTLSRAGSHKKYYYFDGDSFGLYYSSCDDDYKILHITPWHDPNPNVYIYSLKSDSWRKVESSPDFQISYYHWFQSPTALLNEILYFLVNKRENYEQRSYSIIRFDTKTEKFTHIAPPFPGTTVFWLVAGHDCIYLCVHIAGRGDELWRMDGDGDWTKVESFPFFPWDQEPLHLTRNENLLMFSGCDYNTLYQLEVKKHTNKILCGLPNRTTIVKYMETIVSPNQYTN